MRNTRRTTPSIGSRGGTMGRPRKMPPKNAAKTIRACASDGWGLVGIASRLGIDRELLGHWFNDYPELKLAFDEGRELERHTLHNTLFRQATEGNNMIAAMFLLKSRHGYREGDQGEQVNRVSINFTLPGALRPEQYTIDNEPADRTVRVPAARPPRS